MTVTDVSSTWAVVIFRVKVILYRQWMVFMSLVIDLIGQLDIYVISCNITLCQTWQDQRVPGDLYSTTHMYMYAMCTNFSVFRATLINFCN